MTVSQGDKHQFFISPQQIAEQTQEFCHLMDRAVIKKVDPMVHNNNDNGIDLNLDLRELKWDNWNYF